MIKERLKENYNDSCTLERDDFAEWLIIWMKKILTRREQEISYPL